MNHKLTNYLNETISRVFLKSPKYFKIVQIVGLIATGIGFLPDIAAYLGINLPDNQTVQLVLKVAGGTTYFISKLPVENSSVVQKQTNTLPFSDINKTDANIQKD